MTVYPNAIDGDAKKCSKCKLLKKTSEFGKSSKSTTGLKSACKACLRKQARDYAKKKRSMMTDQDCQNHAKKCKKWREDKIKEDHLFWQKEYNKNKEKNRKKAREYYHRNIDECRLAIKKYQKNNREKVRKSAASWKRNNPDKVKKYKQDNIELYREAARKRRALKNGNTISYFSHEELMLRMSVFGFKCAYCGGNFDHVDHVIPLAKGGYHCLANLRPACESCNCSKSSKKLNEWLGEKAS